MSTHAIGRGTVNFNINMPEEERNLYGKIAFDEDRPTGSLLRILLREGLRARYPDRAAVLDKIRRTAHRVIESATILFLGCSILWQTIHFAQDMRRPTKGKISIRKLALRKPGELGFWQEEEA